MILRDLCGIERQQVFTKKKLCMVDFSSYAHAEEVPLNPRARSRASQPRMTTGKCCRRVLVMILLAGLLISGLLVLLALTASNLRSTHPMLREAGRCLGYAVFGPRLMGPLVNTKRLVPRFTGDGSAGRRVRVAIIGTGISGLVAANAFIDSNARLRRRGAGYRAAPPEFEVSVFSDPVAQLSAPGRTVAFRLRPGQRPGDALQIDVGHHPFFPAVPLYAGWRRFARRVGLRHRGPLKLRVHAESTGSERDRNEPERDREAPERDRDVLLDAECAVLRRVVRFVRTFPGISRLVYGAISLRGLLKLHGLSDAFFVRRLYPSLRLLTAATPNSTRLLDASAFIALLGHVEGWVDCDASSPFGAAAEWYSVENGSAAYLQILEGRIGSGMRRGSRVLRVREGERGVEIVHIPKGGGATRAEHFDAVVMATTPDDARSLLGPQAPPWTDGLASEATTVVVHSDEEATGLAGAATPHTRGVADGAPSVVCCTRGGVNTASMMVSVYWDALHGEGPYRPRPIVTYNPEQSNRTGPFAGETFRGTFRRVQLPTVSQSAAVRFGITDAHNRPGARLFWAAAWTHFSTTLVGGIRSGFAAAYSIGAVRARRLAPDAFVVAPRLPPSTLVTHHALAMAPMGDSTRTSALLRPLAARIVQAGFLPRLPAMERP